MTEDGTDGRRRSEEAPENAARPELLGLRLGRTVDRALIQWPPAFRASDRFQAQGVIR